MINRHINSYSYDDATDKIQNRTGNNIKRDYKKKLYSSSKKKKEEEKNLLEKNNIDNEIKKNLFSANVNEIPGLSIENHKIKSKNYPQNKNSFKSFDKNELKLFIEQNDNNIKNNIFKEKKDEQEELKTRNNIFTIQNKSFIKAEDFMQKRFFYNNKCDYLENEKDNNKENDSRFINFYKITKDKEKYNQSLIGFRKSNYYKYRKEKEKNKRIYNSKRLNKILEDRSLKSQKEVKIYPLANNILHYKENEDLNKELLSKKNIKNENSNDKEDSFKKYEKLKDNDEEENEKDMKKEDITGYRYKVPNWKKKLKLKNEILSEMNNIKKKLLNNESNKKEDVIHKKLELNIIKDNYIYKTEKINNNNIYDNRSTYNAKYNSLNNDNISKYIYKENNFKEIKNKRYNSLENLYHKKRITPTNPTKPTYNNNNINKTIYNNCYTEDNICDRNNTFNNLMDYKYNYYINKKNKKIQGMKNGHKPNTFGGLNNLINDFLKIKNSRKKRFHREINKTEDDN